MHQVCRSEGTKRVTLTDVAKDARVSRSTASLVLRGSPLVANETSERVLASMRDLGYVYNRAAANLRTQRSQTIGVVVTDITNPFFSQMTVGSEAKFEEANCVMLLSNTSDELSKQDHLLKSMLEYGVEGILLCLAKSTTPETIHLLHRWRLPFVLVARYLLDVEADYVGGDNVLGAEMAVEHLLALGHRRIAFVGGPADSSARQDRLSGYQRALDRRGLTVDHSLLSTSQVNYAGGHQAIAQQLKRPDPPTAVVCYNDVVAFGVMLGLQAAGKTPGEDFSVVGFDDIEEAALWRPALTTVSVPPRQIGMEATRLLLERIAEPDGAPRQIILPPALVVRESCGRRKDRNL